MAAWAQSCPATAPKIRRIDGSPPLKDGTQFLIHFCEPALVWHRDLQCCFLSLHAQMETMQILHPFFFRHAGVIFCCSRERCSLKRMACGLVMQGPLDRFNGNGLLSHHGRRDMPQEMRGDLDRLAL